jgi:hypothetical protein
VPGGGGHGADLQGGEGERDREVAEREERPRDRSGEQIALGDVVAVDDHADPGEHRVDGNQEPDRADGDKRLVADTGVQRLPERRSDHEREQDRHRQRHEQLVEAARGQLASNATGGSRAGRAVWL